MNEKNGDLTNGKDNISQEQDALELGKFYFYNGRYAEAIESFNRTLQINKNNEEAYYNLGLIYENQNAKDLAQKMFERALQINPDYKKANQHLNKLKGLK
ncbi:MAG: tetratricopeptide repeat protein [bacterium]